MGREEEYANWGTSFAEQWIIFGPVINIEMASYDMAFSTQYLVISINVSANVSANVSTDQTAALCSKVQRVDHKLVY